MDLNRKYDHVPYCEFSKIKTIELGNMLFDRLTPENPMRNKMIGNSQVYSADNTIVDCLRLDDDNNNVVVRMKGIEVPKVNPLEDYPTSAGGDIYIQEKDLLATVLQPMVFWQE